MEIPSAIQIGKVRGIPIRLHLTFLLVLPFFAYVMGQSYFAPEGGDPSAFGYLWGALLAVVLFTCVTLHELSHSITAQRYGIRVRSIVLLPIGGVSQMEDMPREPRKELIVSAAGPLTNFVIAAPLLALGFLGLVPEVLPQFQEFVRWAGLLNVFLGAFNLFLPAFPMDGGRILRSLLASRMSFLKATRYASGVGRAIAFAMGLLGFFTLPGGIWLLLIAFFIYMGASEEERVVEVMHTLGNLRVRDLMTASPVILRPDDTLEQAFRVMVDTKHVGFPVVESDGRVIGFLGLPDLGKIDRVHYAFTPVRLAMRVPPPTIDPATLVTDALRQMTNNQEEHLVVLDQGRLAGILTKTD
ncbi:MAG TPA: site-2 protease family protein, partial [Candidatus Thermoplasmatota archaeon]|nr:site-2 protease family protein [Candidatus Thermoplasmatota archaeon]